MRHFQSRKAASRPARRPPRMIERRGPNDSVRRIICFSACFWIACFARGASADPGAPARIFAAASLVDLLQDLQPGLEATLHRPVTVSTASSATLARQIQLGAAADLFVSASPQWIDMLEKGAMVHEGTMSTPWLSNVLVCITPADSPLQLHSEADLTPEKVETLALAVETAPLGTYSRQALSGAHVSGGRRIVSGSDARDTLLKVALGAADAGIVYATDARAEPRVRVAFELCPDSYTSVVYPLACVGPDAELCAAITSYLFSDAARTTVAAHGFILLDRTHD